ncbi:hypothetical protein BC938DRAFT_476375 [Jimgerdemannia flammicorona]|uniref:Uncharacterized protein n=1 Tax=Jimgerdemannia flammicorona TaxID=994334 RepID=A0A433PHK4_9FUNG|nr:hypothetical protein BC938DRAFT_476375 [Jimgerdemannia flammicorona]
MTSPDNSALFTYNYMNIHHPPSNIPSANNFRMSIVELLMRCPEGQILVIAFCGKGLEVTSKLVSEWLRGGMHQLITICIRPPWG